MASMNAGIILAGQPLNALGALNAGTTAARNTNAARQENALAGLYQTQGPGLLSGDPTAINALSRLDPSAAFDLQASHERLQLARAAGARAAAAAAASQTAAERAAEEEQTRRGLAAARTAQTAEEWDAIATQFGAEDLVGQFDQRDAVIAFYEGYSEPQAPSYREFGGNLYAETPGGLELTLEGTPEANLRTVGGQVVDFSDPNAPRVVFEGDVSPDTVVNVGGNGSEFVDRSDRLAADRFDGYVSQANQAVEFMGDIQTLAELSQSVETGMGAQFTAAVGPLARALGVELEGLDAAQAYEAIVARLAPQMRAAGSGATSDFEARQFLRALPSLGRTPEGNRVVTQTLSALQQHRIAVGDLARQAQRGEMTWQEAERQMAQLGNPYEAFNSFEQTEPQPAAQPEPSDGERTSAADPRMQPDGTIPFESLSETERSAIRNAVAAGQLEVEEVQTLFPGFTQ